MILLLFVFTIIFLLYNNRKKLISYYRDIKYNAHFYLSKNLWNDKVLQNEITTIHKIPLKILFITFETRDLEFVSIHNSNISKYCSKMNRDLLRDYEYKFISECTENHIHNVYWCKFVLLLKELEREQYDYVVWLDSDTIVCDDKLDIGDVLCKYDSSIFVGFDRPDLSKIVNAGIIFIKNDSVGKEFMTEMVNLSKTTLFKNECMDKNGQLNGIFAGTCYEQGVLNELILTDKYAEYTTILPPNYILNDRKCPENNKTFLFHQYDTKSEKRKQCFSSILDGMS